MGLSIKEYSYSYSRLQDLREMALCSEGITIPIREFYYQNKIGTKYNEFINHCDCEGIYISKKSKQYEKYRKRIINNFGIDSGYFGDLDKLKEEVQELNEYMLKNLEFKQPWIDFYNDVMSTRMILEFHWNKDIE